MHRTVYRFYGILRLGINPIGRDNRMRDGPLRVAVVHPDDKMHSLVRTLVHNARIMEIRLQEAEASLSQRLMLFRSAIIP